MTTTEEALDNAIQNYRYRGVEPASVTLVEMALYVDGADTECSGIDYARIDTTTVLAAASGGEVSGIFDFNVNAETATRWAILHDDVIVERGTLLEPSTGSFSFEFRSDVESI